MTEIPVEPVDAAIKRITEELEAGNLTKETLTQFIQAHLFEAWNVGFREGSSYQRNMWYWSAGDLSRAVNGLKERPVAPDNPHKIVR